MIDRKVVISKVFKRWDLALNFAVWRALARVPFGAICCQGARKNLKPKTRWSLETGAVLDGALSSIFASIGEHVCDERTRKM